MAERMDDYDAGLFQESSAEDYALADSAVALASLCHISSCYPERSRGTPDPFLCRVSVTPGLPCQRVLNYFIFLGGWPDHLLTTKKTISTMSRIGTIPPTGP